LKYVGEREFCFDQSELGFPSISGCHAIVYVTANGLFGYHNYGGQTPDRWPGMSAAFGNFVHGNVNGGGAGKLIYGVCYATTNRSYPGIAKATWLAELAAFGTAVGFTGPIWGYDLAVSGIPPSAYVTFFHTQGTCVIQVRKWVDHEDTLGPNASPTDHKTTAPASPVYKINNVANVVVSVGATALKTVYPDKLR
jgi:hypothetical protein